MGGSVHRHGVALDIQLVPHNHHRLLFIDSHSNENVIASLLDDEGNPLRFHALPGRRVVEGVNDDDYIGLHINH